MEFKKLGNKTLVKKWDTKTQERRVAKIIKQRVNTKGIFFAACRIQNIWVVNQHWFGEYLCNDYMFDYQGKTYVIEETKPYFYRLNEV